MPRRNSSFACVELHQLLPLPLDLLEQLEVPDRDRDLAGVQLEEVLVGGIPAPRRRQMADEDAEPLVRQRQDGPDRARLAGDVLLDRAPSSDRRARCGRRSSRTPSGRCAWRAPPGARGRHGATSRRSRAGSARAPGCAARGRPPAGCGSPRALPARPRRPPPPGPSGRPHDVRSTALRDRAEGRGQAAREEVREEDGHDRPRRRARTRRPPRASSRAHRCARPRSRSGRARTWRAAGPTRR